MTENKLIKGLKTTAIIFALTLGVLIFIEGLASSVLFVDKFIEEKRSVITVEEKHTQFDETLGWTNIPNLQLRDFYGPGRSLSTNNLGFRGERNTAASTTAGKSRIICSGDSYTLGYGVGDGDTWCALLEKLQPEYETVNMGQGGYGIDQAYLWYERDGAQLSRKVHILGFIGHDFLRMQHNHFRGYSKPVIKLESGELVVSNVPLTQKNVLVRWLIQNGYIFNNLQVVQLLNLFLEENLDLGSSISTGVDSETWDVLTAIFDNLQAENKSKNSDFFMIFLPVPWDYESDRYTEIREQLENYSNVSGVVVIDFVEKLRTLEKSEADKLFFAEDEAGYPHLNEAGNRWVAEELLIYLESKVQ